MKKSICLILSIFFIFLNGCSTAPNNIETTVNIGGSDTNLSTSDSNALKETDDYPDEDANPASDFEYTVRQDGEFVITKYIGNDESVVIPRKIAGKAITVLGESSFADANIVSVIMPNTVKYISAYAFGNCEKLEDIQMSSSLITIGLNAFSNCISLSDIDFSSTALKGIDAYAFRGCKKLKEVTLSNTLVEIREKAFYECSALLEIDFPQSLTKIAGGAFAYCTSLKCVSIPTKLSLTSFDEAIFHNVPALEQITFKEGREEITGYALIQTDESVEIVVPRSVKRFSPLPFLINPTANITITFLGDAPEIVDDDTDWFGNPIIYYDETTNGWDKFIWNEKYTVKPIGN